MGKWLASRLTALAAAAGLVSSAATVATTAACDDSSYAASSGAGGAGGAGGAPGCPDDVAPLFTLRVVSAEGALPEDLQLQVSWSAGDEPVVALADTSTYGTTEDNVVCRRNASSASTTAATGASTSGTGGAGGYADPATTAGSGGGDARDELVCELWTSGATRVRLDATGYVPFDDTLPPATTDGCDHPVPSEVEIEVVPEAPPEDDE